MRAGETLTTFECPFWICSPDPLTKRLLIPFHGLGPSGSGLQRHREESAKSDLFGDSVSLEPDPNFLLPNR